MATKGVRLKNPSKQRARFQDTRSEARRKAQQIGGIWAAILAPESPKGPKERRKPSLDWLGTPIRYL